MQPAASPAPKQFRMSQYTGCHISYGGVVTDIGVEQGELVVISRLKAVDGRLIPVALEAGFTPADSTKAIRAEGQGSKVRYDPAEGVKCVITHGAK